MKIAVLRGFIAGATPVRTRISGQISGMGTRPMQFKSSVLFAVGCAGLLALNVPAFGAPVPQGHAHQRAVQKKKMLQIVQTKPRIARDDRATHLVSTRVIVEPRRPLFGWPVLVREARRYMGTNPTRRSRLWCATFMNMVLAKAGYSGTNSDAAKSFASYGHRVAEPEVGAIAVLTRGNRGGHVGVVSGVDQQGNPIIISGNHGHQVGEGVYPRSRVIAYVIPSDRRSVSDIQVAERMPNPPAAPKPAQSGPSIDSPISELLAAIEAEQNRSAAAAAAVAKPIRPPEPPTPHLVVQQVPERPAPHLTVQQMPERLSQPPRLAPVRPQPMQLRRHVASADVPR
jgi:uncharacterized protein (TIGR02594 family)